MNILFSSGDKFDISHFENAEEFTENYPEHYSINVKDTNEFSILIELLELTISESIHLNGNLFSIVHNVSGSKFPDLSNKYFDNFFFNWIDLSGRENSMDEYGQLIFLSDVTKKWNRNKFRFILFEK